MKGLYSETKPDDSARDKRCQFIFDEQLFLHGESMLFVFATIGLGIQMPSPFTEV